MLLVGNGDGTFEPVAASESGLVVPGDAKSAVSTDLNADGRPDLVVGVNDGETLAWQRDAARAVEGDELGVRLIGLAGNPTGIGARITVAGTSGRIQTAEVHAGGGYLSQSSPVAWFGGEAAASPASLHVRWPDGRDTHLEAPNFPERRGGAMVIERR